MSRRVLLPNDPNFQAQLQQQKEIFRLRALNENLIGRVDFLEGQLFVRNSACFQMNQQMEAARLNEVRLKMDQAELLKKLKKVERDFKSARVDNANLRAAMKSLGEKIKTKTASVNSVEIQVEIAEDVQDDDDEPLVCVDDTSFDDEREALEDSIVEKLTQTTEKIDDMYKSWCNYFGLSAVLPADKK